MGKFQTFQQFLATQSVEVPVLGFIINFLLAALLAYLLNKIYVKYGTSISNRRLFASNFILITTTTMLIITIVKSSLALSLGLVGALSIVRFRAAIKEPEELAYLFLSIAFGLGFGADQRVITIISFILITIILVAKNIFRQKEENENLYLTISSSSPDTGMLEEVTQVLKNNCSSLHLKRYDSSSESLEASYIIEFENVAQLNTCEKALKKISKSLTISFLDNKGIA